MNVLIIDDTPADHQLCVNYLDEDEGGYRFLHAYTGGEGLKMYRSHPVDCILLDYNLPDMTGLEVLEKLTAMGKIAPVIMMTGEGNEIIAVNAMKMGSQDYIPKDVVTSSALKRAVDHTARHTELLKRMETYRSELERSNSDLELFANVVAHDLKSPLRAVSQHLSLIKKRAPEALDAKAMRSLDFAVDGAVRMHALIDTLFTYARLGFAKPEFTPVDMGKILKDAGQDLCIAIEESGARITSDELPVVSGDAMLLSQLMQNLLANAIKYCRHAPRIHASAAAEGDSWRISLKDNGIGIPRLQYEKIFTIFRRLHTEEEYPGIGLGLAVCDRIVKQHGGRIWVESEPDAGSTFHFTLPRPAQAAQKKVAYG